MAKTIELKMTDRQAWQALRTFCYRWNLDANTTYSRSVQYQSLRYEVRLFDPADGQDEIAGAYGETFGYAVSRAIEIAIRKKDV